MEKFSNDLNGRILHVKIFYNSEILNITNIYAPSGKSNRTQNHRFFENLYPYIPLHHPTILAGDFNCVENPQLDKYPPVKTYSKPLTLLDLTRNLNLIDSFRTQNPTSTTFTRHTSNSHSRLDRFYTNHLCNPKNHIFIPTPFSDHDIVILTLNTSSKPTTQTSFWKNNVSNFGQEQQKNEIIKLIETHSQITNTTHDKNPLENWQNLKKKIKQLLIKQAQDISKQKQYAYIIENQTLFKLREKMIAQPTKLNFELYHKQQKQMHNTSLSEARITYLKPKLTWKNTKTYPFIPYINNSPQKG